MLNLTLRDQWVNGSCSMPEGEGTIILVVEMKYMVFALCFLYFKDFLQFVGHLEVILSCCMTNFH